jgi:hypothetical protein
MAYNVVFYDIISSMSQLQELITEQRGKVSQYILSKECNHLISQGREALESHHHGDSSQLCFFSDRGVGISFEITPYSKVSGSEEDLTRFPSRATRQLQNDEEVVFNFVQMPFAIRNLLAVVVVPEEEISDLLNAEKSFIVALTSNTIEDPLDSLFVYSVFNSSTKEYDVQRLSMNYRDAQDLLLYQPTLKKIVCCYLDSEQNEITPLKEA